MIPEERRKKILESLEGKSSATVTELGLKFNVSDMTIHRDLKFLESIGSVRKTFGGVILNDAKIETDFSRRLDTNREGKQIIGHLAVNQIEDGDCIILDASSTCVMMIQELMRFKKLTIFTNGCHMLNRLAESKSHKIYSTGGQIYEDTNWLVGPSTIHFIKKIHANKCFLSAAGLSIPEGLTVPIAEISEVEQAMREASNEVILLADKSKFRRISHFRVFSLDEVDLLISDAEKDDLFVSELMALDINILLAS